MKKIILSLALGLISFVALPCGGGMTNGMYYACGSADVAQVIQSGINNCPIGSTFYVQDVCANNWTVEVRVEAMQ
jgi:hypothetical protein